MRTFHSYPLDDSFCSTTGKRMAPPPFKREITLLCFLRLGNIGMNQPEATEIYGDSCLNTSVSYLQNRNGITISRRLERWTHRHGGKTHFTRYWLACPKQEVKAVALLNKLRAKRGMYPIQPGEYFTLPNKTL
jgi:hypothetical protein